MKCVTYNIHYGVGLDGKYDPGRIADAVRGADVVALQEVSRNNPANGGRDMVTELRAHLPGYFAVYGSNFEIDMGSRLVDGKATDAFFSLGNMILSRTPVLASRNLLLPRRRSFGAMNFQRGALEALIETPLGPIRFYSTHLDHRGPDERLQQVRFLRNRLIGYPLEGGAISGTTEMGFPEPPHPEAYVAMGDFNMLEGSPEYTEMVGDADHHHGRPLVATHAVDAALVADPDPRFTSIDIDAPDDESRHKRIDYVFVAAGLAGNVRSAGVDAEAVGSDHRPLWVELA